MSNSWNTTKMITIFIVATIPLCLPLKLRASSNKNGTDKDYSIRMHSKFKKCWDETSSVLANMFGTTTLMIPEHSEVDCLKAFETFILKQAVNSNVTLIKRRVKIEDLILLPRPIILLDKDKTSFTPNIR